MIGYLGDTVFEVNSDRILTLGSLSISSEARYATHDVIGKKPVLEFIGPGLKSASFPIRLDVKWKVNISDEINKIEAIKDSGTAVPLVIGETYHGDFVVKNTSIIHKNISNTGVIIVAELSITLEEYADDRVSGNS